jgi:hypothetical protein
VSDERPKTRHVGIELALARRFRPGGLRQGLFKAPGIAETLDRASALTESDAVALDPAMVSDRLDALLKF